MYKFSKSTKKISQKEIKKTRIKASRRVMNKMSKIPTWNRLIGMMQKKFNSKLKTNKVIKNKILTKTQIKRESKKSFRGI